MGYLVTSHILKERTDFSALQHLPKSIATRIYYHRKVNAYLIDVFSPTDLSGLPFQKRFPSKEISLDLPQSLDSLELIYKFLMQVKFAESFKKSYINFCCRLSELLSTNVFSFVSDDDQYDFACSASNGVLRRLKCRCADLNIFYDGTKTQIIPLMPESEYDSDYLTDVSGLKIHSPKLEVLARNTEWDLQIHSIATSEIKNFLNMNDSILGLGTFDTCSDASDWELIS
jgi:hypothetical protein